MEFKVEKGWSYPSVDSGIIAFAWKSLINVVILHSKHQGADYCRTDQRKIISNFITADGLLQRKHLNLRTSNLFISVHAAAFLTPLCLCFPSLRPLGGGCSPGRGSALGLWGRVCLSERGTVLPLQGPLGAAPGYTHLGEHQVCSESH